MIDSYQSWSVEERWWVKTTNKLMLDCKWESPELRPRWNAPRKLLWSPLWPQVLLWKASHNYIWSTHLGVTVSVRHLWWEGKVKFYSTAQKTLWTNTVVIQVLRLPGRSIREFLEWNNQNFWESENILIPFKTQLAYTDELFVCLFNAAPGDATSLYSSASDHWLFLYYWVVSINKKWHVSPIILFYEFWILTRQWIRKGININAFISNVEEHVYLDKVMC